MSIRNTLNNNPAVAIIGAIVLLVFCLGFIVFQVTGGSGVSDQVYFFDTNTGKVFTAKATTRPIQAPSAHGAANEPAGFQARIQACGQCGNYEGMTLQQVKDAGAAVAYLMRRKQSAGPTDIMLISEADPVQWVSGTSPAGRRATRVQLQCDESHSVNICMPSE